MCFVALNLEKRIADKPIVCYKKVFADKTRHRKFRFWKRALISATSIVTGYEYIPWKDNPTVELNVFTRSSWCRIQYYIEAGYHSYIYKPTGTEWRETIVKCIIPKGSTYYVNNSEYVSSNLIMTDEII